jgi:hypothetical protein
MGAALVLAQLRVFEPLFYLPALEAKPWLSNSLVATSLLHTYISLRQHFAFLLVLCLPSPNLLLIYYEDSPNSLSKDARDRHYPS